MKCFKPINTKELKRLKTLFFKELKEFDDASKKLAVILE